MPRRILDQLPRPRRLFSFLAIPMLFLAQCAPSGCAPPGTGRGVVISIGQMQTFGFGGHVGADYLDGAENKICPDRSCGYWALRNFSPDGFVDGGGIPIEANGVRQVRVEFYPDLEYGKLATNDNWSPAMAVGGIHFWDPDGRAVNGIQLPHASNGAFRFVGSVTDGGRPVADGRVSTFVFQVVNKDTTIGAFNIADGRNSQWTAGWIWAGEYIVVIADHATGRSVTGRANIFPGATVNLDLRGPCFGLPTC
jgi:hypothetical protein